MITEILVIGDSERIMSDYSGHYVWWEPDGLRLGIFVTTIGALALAGPARILTLAWNGDIEDSRARRKATQMTGE